MEAQAAAPTEAAPAAPVSVPSAAAPPPPAGAEAPAATPEAAPAPAPEPPAAPEPDPFDWSQWDGTVDVLPEDMRELGQRFHEHYHPKFASQRDELSQLNSWYEALGKEDPQIGVLQQSLNDLKEAHAAELQGWTDKQSQWDAMLQKDAEDYSAWFWEQNADIQKDDRLRSRLDALMDHGFEPEDAAALARLADDVVKKAAEAMARGANSAMAVEFAQLHAKTPAPAPQAEPSKSALLVDDGTGRQRPSDAEPTMSEMVTPKQRRILAARRALKAHGLPTK